MTDKFLQAKHWQLFLLLFGIPLLFQIGVMVILFSNFDPEMQTSPDPEIFLNVFAWFPLVILIFSAVFFSWIWSVGIGLQPKLPDALKMNVGKFKLAIAVPAIFFVFLFVAMSYLFSNPDTIMATADPGFTLFLPIFVLYFLSIFCMIYIMYFAAKTLKTAELQREPKIGEYIGEFFLFWFYPLGVWFIQPVVNRLVNSEAHEDLI